MPIQIKVKNEGDRLVPIYTRIKKRHKTIIKFMAENSSPKKGEAKIIREILEKNLPEVKNIKS